MEWEISFGAEGTNHAAVKGDLVGLAGPHDLTALNSSIARLSPTKFDRSERVKEAASLKRGS